MSQVSNVAATTPARVSVLDPDLPFLASQAAIELDNLLLGNLSGLAVVQELARRLRETVELPTAGGEFKALMDLPTVSAMSDALRVVGSRAVRSLPELAAEASQVANDLDCRSTDRERQTIERARLFCVTLSQLATSYQQSVYDNDPLIIQGR